MKSKVEILILLGTAIALIYIYKQFTVTMELHMMEGDKKREEIWESIIKPQSSKEEPSSVDT